MNAERLLQQGLWQSRLVIVPAVVASLAIALGVFYMVTVDAVYTLLELRDYASPLLDAKGRELLYADTIGAVIAIVDGYLLGAVLLIFALGLYELFISPIEPAQASAASGNVLVIRTLDDLKNSLAKVILIILVVKFFDYVLHLKFQTPLELLYLAAGIALIGLALYLAHSAEKSPKAQ